MDKKQLGGYLAPEIKVKEIHSRAVMCVSPDLSQLGVSDNPFSGNGETDW